LIFANPDGSPLKPNSISATVSALFKRLKIPKPKDGALHLLRHTLASQMPDSGVPLPVVSQRLGHSSVRETADVYAHAIHGQDDEAVRRWEEYQQRNRPAKAETCNGSRYSGRSDQIVTRRFCHGLSPLD
jgi:integrase